MMQDRPEGPLILPLVQIFFLSRLVVEEMSAFCLIDDRKGRMGTRRLRGKEVQV